MAMMLNRKLKSGLCLLCAVSTFALAGVPQDAHAQQCNAPFEMVTTLFYPEPGAYAIWKAQYGQPKIREVFQSALPVAGGGAIAAGERGEGAARDLIIAQYDKRGRKVNEKVHKITGLQKVVKILPRDGGYVIAANVHAPKKSSAIWVGFFDKDGMLLGGKSVDDGANNITANDMIASHDGEGFVVAVSRNKKSSGKNTGNMKKDAGIFLLDAKGIASSKKFFILGQQNEIKNLSVSKVGENDLGYIAAGWFENAYSKRIGWVMRVAADGSLIWQREFERGLGASIMVVHPYNEQSFLAFGSVAAADSGLIGAWAAMLDTRQGQILWQRYYRGEHADMSYHARGALVNKDGLISLVMQAKAEAGEDEAAPKADDDPRKALLVPAQEQEAAQSIAPPRTDYVHVLNVTPRGITVSGDAYFEGQSGHIAQAVEGEAGARLFAGYANVPDGEIAAVLAERAPSGEAVPVASEQALPKPNLPQAEMSDKAREGLAMLGRNVAAQVEGRKQPDSGESSGALKNASADDFDESQPENSGINANGWLLMATPLDAYIDPCNQAAVKPKF